MLLQQHKDPFKFSIADPVYQLIPRLIVIGCAYVMASKGVTPPTDTVMSSMHFNRDLDCPVITFANIIVFIVLNMINMTWVRINQIKVFNMLLLTSHKSDKNRDLLR